MNEMLAPINRFVETMIESKDLFQQVKLEIDSKNQGVEGCIQQLQKNIGALRGSVLETDDEALKKLYTDVQRSLGELLDGVAEVLAKTRKSTKFIQDYEQSFNVAVFGKVKAGKSYLGNFIMGNQLRELGLETAYRQLPRPTVEVYDRGTVHTQDRLSELSEEGNDGFFVNANEATSAIQLFRLGGLTWFDTPGIGSVTWENEMLAKDYVDNADLVVYASNSDAAGTRQDLSELKELYRKGKQFLLLLTQSDTLEEDFDDETGDCYSRLTAKSEKDRRDTETYMRDALEENGLPRLREDEVLTVSAMLAMTALEEGDEAGFADSHMGDFLRILTDITKTDGARLKRETPFVRMRDTVRALLNHLDDTEKKFREYETSLRASQNNLRGRSVELQEQIRQQCRSRIDTLIEKKVMEIEKSGDSIGSAELSDLISREIHGVLQSSCAKEFTASDQILADYKDSLRLEGVGDLEMKQDAIHYTIQRVQRVQRDPEGILENIGALFGKEYYTSRVREVSKTSYVDIGVNEGQVKALTHKLLDQLIEEKLPEMLGRLGKRYFTEIQSLTDAAGQCIQSAKQGLRQELEGLGK